MSGWEPVLSLCMIVKNEERHLPHCLDSVRGLVDEIIVVDTGSTDGTVRLAESYGARILHHQWQDDFAAARNVGLEAAAGDWVMVLDADEELHPEDRHLLRALCRNPDVEAYSMVQMHLTDAAGLLETEICYDIDLWRNRKEYRFESALHEQILPAIRRAKPDAVVQSCPIRIRHYGFLQQTFQAKGKSERNLRLARKLVAEHPDDFFYRFNLALELQGTQDYAAAAAEYEQVRLSLTWWPDWTAKLFKCLATCLIMQRRWEEAEAILRQGLAVFPRFTDLVFLRGLAAQEQGNHARAAVCFRLCLEMGPGRELGAWPGLAGHRAFEALARSYVALGRVEEAAEAFASAFCLQPGWTAPLAAMVEGLSGWTPDHLLCDRLSAFFDLAQPSHRIRRADVLLAGGRPDLALDSLDPLDPAPPVEAEQARYLMGLSLFRLGRYGEALEVLASGPETPDRHAGGPLLAALSCHRGSGAVHRRAARGNLAGEAYVEAARLCLKEAEFWVRVGRRPDSCPPWVASAAGEGGNGV